jgi:hypothetical protein
MWCRTGKAWAGVDRVEEMDGSASLTQLTIVVENGVGVEKAIAG